MSSLKGRYRGSPRSSSRAAPNRDVDETTEIAETAAPQWDVFISHASEDKHVTDPMVKGLVERGFRVWYDRN